MIAAAGLGSRVELRPQGLEQLDEREAYDGAYVAQMFFPAAILADGLARVLRSLKPGGILMTGSVLSDGPGVAAALSRFQSATWGGGERTAEDVARLVRAAGFVDVVIPPVPSGLRPVFARRPPAG